MKVIFSRNAACCIHQRIHKIEEDKLKIVYDLKKKQYTLKYLESPSHRIGIPSVAGRFAVWQTERHTVICRKLSLRYFFFENSEGYKIEVTRVKPAVPTSPWSIIMPQNSQIPVRSDDDNVIDIYGDANLSRVNIHHAVIVCNRSEINRPVIFSRSY